MVDFNDRQKRKKKKKSRGRSKQQVFTEPLPYNNDRGFTIQINYGNPYIKNP
jgi:hypothetical protein